MKTVKTLIQLIEKHSAGLKDQGLKENAKGESYKYELAQTKYQRVHAWFGKLFFKAMREVIKEYGYDNVQRDRMLQQGGSYKFSAVVDGKLYNFVLEKSAYKGGPIFNIQYKALTIVGLHSKEDFESRLNRDLNFQ